MKKNNYFPMPNEIFCLGLNSGEIAVYIYLNLLCFSAAKYTAMYGYKEKNGHKKRP